MKLTKLFSLLMENIDIVEYYNDAMTFLYAFPIEEIPDNIDDKVAKFDIVVKDGKRVLKVVEK